MAPQGNTQWICTNLSKKGQENDKEKGLGGLPRWTSISKFGGKFKIGFVGIAEREWIDTLDPETFGCETVYENYKRKADEVATMLRKEKGCHFVIAVTHMRVDHDLSLAKFSREIDLVLGGHDHFYHAAAVKPQSFYTPEREKVNLVVKSGSDFEDLSIVNVTLNSDGRPVDSDFAPKDTKKKE